MFHCWEFQRDVLNELRVRLDRYNDPDVRAKESRVVVLFDNPTDDEEIQLGREAPSIVKALADSIETPFVHIEPYSWPLDVFEVTCIQLAAAEVFSDSGSIKEATGDIPTYQSIVTVGHLLAGVAKGLPQPFVVHIGPLETYPIDHYAVQDLIHYLVDYTRNMFTVISTSEKYWFSRGRKKTVWHKIKDRLRPFVLENKLRPIENLKEFRALLGFLVEKGALPSDVEARAEEIWESSPSRTVGQLKQAAATSSPEV